MFIKAPSGGDEKTSQPQFDFILRDLYFRLEERDRWDGELTKFLLYANGGGVALTMTFAGVLIGHTAPGAIDEIWAVMAAVVAAAAFTFGIFVVGRAIFIASDYAKGNRTAFRELANKFVSEPDTTYADVFLSLSTLSNKRKEYTGQCLLSFRMFISGVFLAGVAITMAAVLSAPASP